MDEAASPIFCLRSDARWAALGVAIGAVLLCGCGPLSDMVAVGSESCNAIDDDGNGIVDDVDGDADGVCDCLRVGVLGYPGTVHSMDQLKALFHGRAVPTEVLAGQVLTSDLLADLDIVIVQDVQDGQARGTVGREGSDIGIGRAYSDAEVEALRAWVVGGGGLMTLVGYAPGTAEQTNVNRLLAPLGMSYGAEEILDALAGPPFPITNWNSSHPLASGLTQVGFSHGHPVSGGELIAWQPAPGAYDVGRAEAWERGHVFAWGDEWITYDPEWEDATFQDKRLWLNSLKWLTRAGYCQVPVPP